MLRAPSLPSGVNQAELELEHVDMTAGIQLAGGGQNDAPGPLSTPGRISNIILDDVVGGATGGQSPSVDHPEGVMKRKCEYQRGGYCVFHGRKGERIFEHSWVTTTGPDGRKVKQYKRKYHYVCEGCLSLRQPLKLMTV